MHAPTAPSTDPADPSRRRLLYGTGTLALVVGFGWPLATGRKSAQRGAVDAFAPNAYLRITPDERITVMCGSAEMGQGVLTAIPMLLAEELDADWSRIEVVQAPADHAYDNPMLFSQATGGSSTVRGHWLPLRRAGAAAREMLVAAAAAQWKLEPRSLRTRDSTVVAPDGRLLSYGALAASASMLPVPAQPTLKEAHDFRLLGRPLPRLDAAAKIDGTAQFGLDVHLPGMLVAVMARAPLPGAGVARLGQTKALAIRGVQQVLTIPSGVAVLADGYWPAKKGRDALEVEWSLAALAGLSSAQISMLLDDGAAKADAVALQLGAPDATPSDGGTDLQARYEVPYLAHACMEPMNCTAWVREDGIEIWAGTQSQTPAQDVVAKAAGTSAHRVRIHTMMLGGGFGRRYAPDFLVDATLLSQRSGRPVQLIYTREDDMAAGHYRPAAVAHLSATLDAHGMPRRLNIGVGAPSVTVSAGFTALTPDGVDPVAVEGLIDHPYEIAQQRVAYGRREPGPKAWFWRSVGHSQNAFFLEGFIDEMAAATKRDPLEFRRALLAGKPRHRRVLDAAAQHADWGGPTPPGVFRGIALAESFDTIVAQVAHVSVGPDGVPKVHRVVAAVDCGMTVNPNIIRQQIEGAIIFGLSAALFGRITYQDARVQQSNFHDYRVLRMSESPEIDVHILPSTEKPGGVGEPGTPPAAPALVNAIYAATGRRLRTLPIDPSLLRDR